MTNPSTHAKELFPNSPAYQQAWLKMVNTLGNKWLLSTPIKRKEQREVQTYQGH